MKPRLLASSTLFMSPHIIAFILPLLLRRVIGIKQQVNLGILVGDTADDDNRLLAVELAMEYVNTRSDLLPNVTLGVVVNRTNSDRANSLENIQHMCYLVQSGVAAVIAPVGSSVIKTTHPVCAGMNIPHLAPIATDPSLSQKVELYPYLLKMSSPDWEQSTALVDVARFYGWSRFGIIASMDDYGQNGLTRFVQLASQYDWTISSFHYFVPSSNLSLPEITRYLNDIKNKGTRVVVLNCYGHHARVIIDLAHNLGMYGSGWAWLATDGITALPGLYDSCSAVPLYLRGLIGTSPGRGSGQLYDDFRELWRIKTATIVDDDGVRASRRDIEVYDMRTMDAVLTFAYALDTYLADGHEFHSPTFSSAVCSDQSAQPWSDGSLLFHYLTQVNGPGVSSRINFTLNYYTYFANYDVVNLLDSGWNVVGTWTSERQENETDLLRIDSHKNVLFPGAVTNIPRDTVIDLSNVTLRIVTILETPFVMRTSSEEKLYNPLDLYKGLCIDLLKMLQNSMRFKYTIHIVDDGNYGSQDPITGAWNGMMAELISRDAEIAVAPLTISYDRQQYVDFTKPYMDLGLTILMPKENEATDTLGFLQPFDTYLWLAVICAFLVCSVATTMCSYLSPYGYRGSFTQRVNMADDGGRKSRNALRLIDSIWYSFSSWMGQGADVTPLSLSGRFVHGMWWFTVMVISATYTANLAAFLTVKRLDSGINSINDLANQIDIKYGTTVNSAVSKFFKTQVAEPYIKMAAFMQQMGTNVPNSSYGIDRVRNSGQDEDEKFAYIFDSAPLKYAASNTPCTTRIVGNIFNNFGYGLAFPRNSPYVDTFSLEILKLRENGSIEALNSRWISSGACLSSDQESNTKGDRISFETMQGVFICLAVGIGLAFLLILIECLFASFKEARLVRNADGASSSMCGAMRRRVTTVCRDVQHNCFCCCSHGRHDDDHHENNDRMDFHGGTLNGNHSFDHKHSNICLADPSRHSAENHVNPAYEHEIRRGDVIMKRKSHPNVPS